MKGDAKVNDYLNNALRHKLTAVNQYWLHEVDPACRTSRTVCLARSCAGSFPFLLESKNVIVGLLMVSLWICGQRVSVVRA